MTPLTDARFKALLFALIALALLLLFVDKAVIWCSHPLLGYADQTAYLDMARLISQGKLPYVDFFEWNPPLIMYLNLLPIWLARLVHIPPTLALDYCVLALTAVSSYFALWLIYQYGDEENQIVLLPMLLGLVYFSQWQLPAMGEREHLLVLLYLPFFILRGLYWQGKGSPPTRNESIVSGLAAGLGLALKPQFLASAVLVELVFWYQFRGNGRYRRPEIYAVASVFIAYFFSMLLLPQPVWQAYFGQVLPLYVSGLSYSSRALMTMLRGSGFDYPSFVQMALTLPLSVVLSSASPWIAPLGVFALSFFFHYIYGDQVWPYRFLPMAAALVMLDALMLGLLLRLVALKLKISRLLFSLMAAAAIVFSGYVCVSEMQGNSEYLETTKLMDLEQVGYCGKSPLDDLGPVAFSILSHTKAEDKVIFMGTGIEPGYPAILESGRSCGSRYLFCPLPFIDYALEKEPGERWLAAEARAIENYGEDIKANCPALIVIQENPIKPILDKNRFFDRFMADYEPAEDIAGYFRAYVRSGRQAQSAASGATPGRAPSGSPCRSSPAVESELKQLKLQVNQLIEENSDLKQQIERARK